MALGLRSVIYFVDDLTLAKAWYSDVFQVRPYFDEPFYVGFQVGPSELGLDPDLSAGTPGPGGSTAYWAVADIDATLARLVPIGVEVVEPIRDVGGGIRLAVIADPFGNAVGLIQTAEDKQSTGENGSSSGA